MNDNKVYLFISGSTVIFHTDMDAAHDAGLGDPDKTITLAEFEAAGNLVRLIDGAIFLGKTDAEKLLEKQENVRLKRDTLLNSSAIAGRIERYRDQTAAGDVTTDSVTSYTTLLAYKQALRDIPQQAVFATDPDAVVWPELEV